MGWGASNLGGGAAAQTRMRTRMPQPCGLLLLQGGSEDTLTEK